MTRKAMLIAGVIAIALALIIGAGCEFASQEAQAQTDSEDAPTPTPTATAMPTPTPTPVPGLGAAIAAPNGCTLVRSKEELLNRLMARYHPDITHPAFMRDHFLSEDVYRNWTFPTVGYSDRISSYEGIGRSGHARYTTLYGHLADDYAADLRMHLHLIPHSAPTTQLDGFDHARLDPENMTPNIALHAGSH